MTGFRFRSIGRSWSLAFSGGKTLERRRYYRADIGPDDALHHGVLSSAGSSLSGRIIDFSIDGVGLRVPLRRGSWDANPLPAPDDTIELEFPSTQLNKPISASGLVRHRVVEDRTCRYGFQFTDRAQFEHRLWPVFRQLFNRRGAFRVVPDHELPVEVPLPHLRADVTLIDISTTGVAVSVPTELRCPYSMHRGVAIFSGRPYKPAFNHYFFFREKFFLEARQVCVFGYCSFS